MPGTLKATFHLISMSGQRPTGRIQRNKGYFSLNNFYAWAACNGQNSKEYLPTRELRPFFNGQNVVSVFDLHAQDASECQNR